MYIAPMSVNTGSVQSVDAYTRFVFRLARTEPLEGSRIATTFVPPQSSTTSIDDALYPAKFPTSTPDRSRTESGDGPGIPCPPGAPLHAYDVVVPSVSCAPP